MVETVGERNVYIGNRYVPKVMGEWTSSIPYEGLSIVLNGGDSYTSKKNVPIGIPLTNEEYWVVTGNFNAQIENYRKDVTDFKNDLTTKMNDFKFNVKNFGAVGDGVADDTIAIQNAIDHVTTLSNDETYPSQEGKGIVFIPSGKYKITKTLTIPGYISIEGAGRHTTILESYINDGSAVIHYKNATNTEQFYNTLEKFTINGRYQDCVGIHLESVIRWVIREVIVMRTNHEALIIYNSYLGEAYSFYAQTCGNDTHDTVVIDGKDISYGGNAVTFFGGELHGNIDFTSNGMRLKYGYSTRLIGMTIEGYGKGVGFINEQGIATLISGCYFEKNKEHIVELNNTFSANYVSNMFGPLTAGTRGHIGLFYMQAGKIEGNFFFTPTSTKIFDSTPTGLDGRVYFSSIKNNSAPDYPIKIAPSLINSGKTTGTTIETFDGGLSNSTYGRQKFKDIVEFEVPIKADEGINNIGTAGIKGTDVSPKLMGGSGNPNNNIPAPIGSLFLRSDTLHGPVVYIKRTGTTAVGWVPLATIENGTSALRPTVIQQGYQYYDTTLNKPIWYNGSAWIDAAGTIV